MRGRMGHFLQYRGPPATFAGGPATGLPGDADFADFRGDFFFGERVMEEKEKGRKAVPHLYKRFIRPPMRSVSCLLDEFSQKICICFAPAQFASTSR